MFDAHFHIIDPRFPLDPSQAYQPPKFDVDDYRQATAELKVRGGAVVSGSFQGFDQQYLRSALSRLGASFVGVTQLPLTVTDEEIAGLATHQVRAIRFNLHRRGMADLTDIIELGQRVHQVAGWHSEFYVDAQHLPELMPAIERLPRVVIDHLGLTAEGRPHVLELVRQGGFVKATGFGRLSFNVAEMLQQVVDINPTALLFGTDLPSTRAPRPFSPDDVKLVRKAVGGEFAEQVLESNARKLYGLDD